MPFYLGQRYVPDANEDEALAEAERVRAAVHGAGPPVVRLVSTTFVPNEEWVFDLFEAESAAAVERAYAQGAVGYERVTAAIHLTETSTARRTPC